MIFFTICPLQIVDWRDNDHQRIVCFFNYKSRKVKPQVEFTNPPYYKEFFFLASIKNWTKHLIIKHPTDRYYISYLNLVGSYYQWQLRNIKLANSIPLQRHPSRFFSLLSIHSTNLYLEIIRRLAVARASKCSSMSLSTMFPFSMEHSQLANTPTKYIICNR